MHLILYFCGTGNSGEDFLKGYDYLPRDSNVRTIFVEGCDHPEVCNAGIFPDLKKFASRLTKKLFKRKKDALQLSTTDLESLAIGINSGQSTISADEVNTPIESITLCGYSRGAVTCFEVAKQLNKIAPQLPVDIVANQPVPGNSYNGPGTNAASVADCSDLKNLRNVSVILGAYTGAILLDPDTKQETTHSIHRGFFSQIVPKLPHTAHRDLIVIPRESHHQNRPNSPDGEDHLHLQVTKYLNFQGLVTQATVDRKTQEAANTYKQIFGYGPAIFPPASQLQRFFGINKKDIYKYVDKLHPAAKARKGYELEENDLLITWWQKHEKKASRFSTALTKKLFNTIKETDLNDKESLENLFIQADSWLIAKENSSSSRYYQVESLRNHIYHRLVDTLQTPMVELAKLNRSNLEEAGYFLKHWTKASAAASYFKTDATRALDKAFVKHSKADASEKSDLELVAALDAWLEQKMDSKSKRYDLVIEIREHLKEVIDNTYVKSSKPEHRLRG